MPLPLRTVLLITCVGLHLVSVGLSSWAAIAFASSPARNSQELTVRSAPSIGILAGIVTAVGMTPFNWATILSSYNSTVPLWGNMSTSMWAFAPAFDFLSAGAVYALQQLHPMILPITSLLILSTDLAMSLVNVDGAWVSRNSPGGIGISLAMCSVLGYTASVRMMDNPASPWWCVVGQTVGYIISIPAGYVGAWITTVIMTPEESSLLTADPIWGGIPFAFCEAVATGSYLWAVFQKPAPIKPSSFTRNRFLASFKASFARDAIFTGASSAAGLALVTITTNWSLTAWDDPILPAKVGVAWGVSAGAIACIFWSMYSAPLVGAVAQATCILLCTSIVICRIALDSESGLAIWRLLWPIAGAVMVGVGSLLRIRLLIVVTNVVHRAHMVSMGTTFLSCAIVTSSASLITAVEFHNLGIIVSCAVFLLGVALSSPMPTGSLTKSSAHNIDPSKTCPEASSDKTDPGAPRYPGIDLSHLLQGRPSATNTETPFEAPLYTVPAPSAPVDRPYAVPQGRPPYPRVPIPVPPASPRHAASTQGSNDILSWREQHAMHTYR